MRGLKWALVEWWIEIVECGGQWRLGSGKGKIVVIGVCVLEGNDDIGRSVDESVLS